MSFLKFALVLTDIFLSMHVSMSPHIAGVHPSLNSLGSMASKSAWSNENDGSATGIVVE